MIKVKVVIPTYNKLDWRKLISDLIKINTREEDKYLSFLLVEGYKQTPRLYIYEWCYKPLYLEMDLEMDHTSVSQLESDIKHIVNKYTERSDK